MSGKRIRLYISDIDGCLAAPFEPFDLALLQQLRDKVVLERNPKAPGMSICTGRAFGYVEAMVQAIGFETPVLFEGGGAIYHPASYSVEWAPGITDAHIEQAQELLRYYMKEFGDHPAVSVDFGKKTQASMIVRDGQLLEKLLSEVREVVGARYSLLMVADTHVSIDAFPPTLSKENGVIWLGKTLGVALEEMAYIGDSVGDIGAMRRVEMGIAPANANESVKSKADYVCESALIAGVIEGYDLCTRRNYTLSDDG